MMVREVNILGKVGDDKTRGCLLLEEKHDF